MFEASRVGLALSRVCHQTLQLVKAQRDRPNGFMHINVALLFQTLRFLLFVEHFPDCSCVLGAFLGHVLKLKRVFLKTFKGLVFRVCSL